MDRASAPEESPVALHGHLRVNGSVLLDEHQNEVRLRGVSFFWSQWKSQYWNADVVRWLCNDWNVSLIRAAMGVEHGGYLENPGRERQLVYDLINAAIELGIYIVVDWHDHNAERHVEQACSFFIEVSEKFGSIPNIIFETFNEPMSQSWGRVIKPYHMKIVEAIRSHSQNLIILGTRTWSQDVDEAAKDPVVGDNLAYAVHFYAATHKRSLRSKVEAALAMGVAIFASEWGTCDASGNGSLDLAETREWLDFLARQYISDANWAISDKEEAASALRPGAPHSGQWLLEQLTQSGQFVRSSLIGDTSVISAPIKKMRTTAASSSLAQNANCYFRLSNHWKPNLKLNIVNGDRGVAAVKVEATWWSAMWMREDVGNSCFRLVNRWKPSWKLNMVSEARGVAAMPVEDSWESAIWYKEDTSEGFFRLVNRWRPDCKLNIVLDDRGVVAMPVQDDWGSVLWCEESM